MANDFGLKAVTVVDWWFIIHRSVIGNLSQIWLMSPIPFAPLLFSITIARRIEQDLQG